MKHTLYIILYILSICRHGHFFKHETFNYIKNKIAYATEELAPHTKTTQAKDFEVKIDFFRTQNARLVNFTNPRMLHLSNKTYFLLGSDLFLWTTSDKFQINKSYTLPDMKAHVASMLTSEEYQHKNFVLSSFKNGVSHLYSFKDEEEPKHIQSLEHQQELIDAKFYVHKYSLYLVTINAREATFYQWLGEYFDQIHTIPRKSIRLASFTHLDSEIIAFLDDSTSSETTITLYQFDGNLKKIQFLKMPNCYDLKVYRIENKVFMIALEAKNNIIYSWESANMEFVYHAEFQSLAIAKRTAIFSVDNIHLIFFISKSGIYTYRVSINNIQYLVYFEFESRFNTILGVIEEERQLQIFGNQTDGDFSCLSIQYSLHYTEIINSVSYEDPLENCLFSLQDNLEKQLNMFKNENNDIVLATFQNANITSHTNKTLAKNEEVDLDINLEPDFDLYESTLIKLNSTMHNIQREISAIMLKTDDLIKITRNEINKNLLIKTNLTSQNLTVINIDVKTINDVKWIPEKWLSYTTDQVITSYLDAKILNSKNIEISNSTFLENLLLNSENVIIPQLSQLQNLECEHLSTDSINGINFKDIYLKSSNDPIKGLKIFNTVKVENLEAADITYPACNSKSLSNTFNFAPDLRVENLNVQRINNIDWNELRESLFEIGKSKKINGTLSIPNVTINRLQTKKINGIRVEDIATKTTNQTITSKIIFNNVLVKNVNVTTLNGINFNDEILLINSENSVVKGPVKIKNLNGFNTTPNAGSATKQKHYNEVIIIGDLRVKNINLSEDAKIFLKGEEFSFNVSEEYWLKNTNQTIPINVKMLNITTNDLNVKTINGVDVDDFMVVGKTRGNASTDYYFKYLNVSGNIKINPDMEHTPDWINLNENVVRKSGGYKIAGKKVFNGTIVVRDASFGYLNNVEVDSIPTVKMNDLSGYTFDTVRVKGNLTLETTNVDAINDIEVIKLYDGIKLIDEDLRLKKLRLENVSVDELEVAENLNNKNLTGYINEVNRMHDIKQIENIISEGNIGVNIVYNVKSINGVPLDLIKEAVRKGAVMTGNVTFKEDVVIDNLFVKHLNNVNISQLMKRLLYKNWKQSITGKYTFNVVRADQLAASRINEYNIETLIDVTKESPQTLRGNLRFKSVKFLDALYGELPCNIKENMALFQTPPRKTWKSVTVTGNITTLSKDNVLQEIIDNVVRLDVDNIINAPVTFASKVHANFVKSTNDINGIDIKGIFDDALRKSRHDQLVTGHKIFTKMTCAGVQVDGNTDVPIVNAIIIKNLNDSLIRKDLVHSITIKGHKVFKSGLTANHLETLTLSGLKPEDLVNLDDLKPIPNVILDSLNVLGNLTINHINNDSNLDEFLKSRFLNTSPQEQQLSGVYYFNKMELKGPSNVTKINNVDLDDVVFDDDGKQIITASKHFSGNMTIHGDVTIDILNDFNVTEKYHESIFYNKESTLNGDIILQDVTEISGNITAKSINGIPIENIKDFLESNELRRETSEIDQIIKQIEDIVRTHRVNISGMPQEYMYLERSQNLQINIPNTVSAEVFESGNQVLLHITGEEPGRICGFPKICNCRNQRVWQISRDYSPQSLGNKQYERVFSFHSEGIIAHLVTYSVSYNRICSRKNSTNFPYESTTLTWIVPSGPNNQPKTYLKYNLIDGFITGAKFFTYLNETYVVISRFYSPTLGTHNLDCVIYKFGHKEDTIEVMQKIATKGAWTLSLFNSYQGLILVIGNIYDSHTVISGTSTDIYIFNEQTLKFNLLRKFIGTGAISIADVVLDKETQIVVAQRDSPLIILKYNPTYQNFYMFHGIHLESEVLSVSRFYLGGSKKDAYLNVVGENNQFHLYSYQHAEGWRLESRGEIEGLRALVPFSLGGDVHLLAPSTKLSSLLTVQKHG